MYYSFVFNQWQQQQQQQEKEARKALSRNKKALFANYYRYSYLSAHGDLKTLGELYYNQRLIFLYASQNPNVDYAFMKKHTSNEWNYYYVIIKETLENLEQIIKDNIIDPSGHKFFSYNINMTMAFIKKHPDIPWNTDILFSVLDLADLEELIYKYNVIVNKHLFKNKHVTVEFLLRYGEINEYNITELSKNMPLSQLKILAQKNMIDFEAVLQNKNITKDFISRYDMDARVTNSGVIEFIKRN